jgi:replicative DNA helicase
MLVDSDSIGQVLQIIPPSEATRFYRHDHQLLYEALVDLYDVGKPIDLILLEDDLRRRGTLTEIGGREYLLELHESVPSSANAEYYANIVRDKSLLRDLIKCSGEIQHAAYNQAEPAAQILDEAEHKLFDVTEKRVTNQPVTLKQFLDETFEKISTAGEHDVTGVPTGFRDLDELLGGMQYGDLVIVAARPSMGKTALGLSMLEYIGIAEALPCVFFSMEMSKLQITQRMLCSLGYVDMNNLRRGRLTDRDKRQLERARRQMENKPVFIDDKPGMSIMELRAKARRLKQLHDIQVVFVDYLQLMFDPATRESRQQEIAAISRGLKALGRELGIPIVALAQLNRQVEGRDGNRPRMSDLRESGAIEQDADVIVLLHREDYYRDRKRVGGKADEDMGPPPTDTGRTELIVAKQRNGPTGTVEIHFTPQYARFDNAAAPHLSGDAAADAEALAADARGFDEDVALDGDLPPPGTADGDETPF